MSTLLQKIKNRRHNTLKHNGSSPSFFAYDDDAEEDKLGRSSASLTSTSGGSAETQKRSFRARVEQSASPEAMAVMSSQERIAMAKSHFEKAYRKSPPRECIPEPIFTSPACPEPENKDAWMSIFTPLDTEPSRAGLQEYLSPVSLPSSPSAVSTSSAALANNAANSTWKERLSNFRRTGSISPENGIASPLNISAPFASARVSTSVTDVYINEEVEEEEDVLIAEDLLALRVLKKEKQYVEFLNTSLDLYMQSLRSEEVLTSVEYKLVFGDLAQIIGLHREIYMDMKKAWLKKKKASSILGALKRSSPFLKMYIPYAGNRPASQAYIFAFVLLSTGNNPNSPDPTADLRTNSELDPHTREDQNKGYEITLEALTYGKMGVGLRDRSKKVVEILQSLADGHSAIPSLHTCLTEPFNHLQLYHDFVKAVVEMETAQELVETLNLQSLQESLILLQESCRQRHDESHNKVRIFEWDWVLDFDKLQSHCRDDPQVFMTQNRQLGTPMHYSLMSSPRSYLYHGFLDVELGDDVFTVLAILVTDALIFAQPIGERDMSHHKNWVVHTFLQALLVDTIRDSSVITHAGLLQHRLELCLSTPPTSFSIPYQYKPRDEAISLFLMPTPELLQTWTDLLLGWIPSGGRQIDLSSPVIVSARNSYLPGATSRPASYLAQRQGSRGISRSDLTKPAESEAVRDGRGLNTLEILSSQLQLFDAASHADTSLNRNYTAQTHSHNTGSNSNLLALPSVNARVKTGRADIMIDSTATIVGNTSVPTI